MTVAGVERSRYVLEHFVSDFGYDRSRLSLRLGNQKDTVMEATASEAPAATQKPGAQPTIGGSVYVKPQELDWEPTQFEGISIKVLYEDKPKGEMTCLLKWEPGATLPMHRHPEIEQTFVIEGSFYDHDGICRAGEFVWRRVGSFHETHSDEGAVILAVYRKPNVFQHSTGYAQERQP
jgi:anti-sigma factor ChrR (cupin superfamily)